MIGTTRMRLGATVAMGLVVAGVVTVSSLTASGADGLPPLAPPAGGDGTLTIVLNADRTGYVELKVVGQSQTVVQAIKTGEPCAKLVFEPLPGNVGDLVELTPIVGDTISGQESVQIPGDYLGVHDGSNCGGPAGQIGFEEELRIGLGSYFGAEVKATSARLAIEKTNRQDRELRWALDPAQMGLTTSWTGTTKNLAVGRSTVEVSGTPSFRSIALGSTATANSRGLSVVTGTSFELEGLGAEDQYDVNCGQRVTEFGNPAVGDIAKSVTYVRGENLGPKETGDPDPPCDEVLVTVRIDGGERVFFDNTEVDAGGNIQRVRATVTIEWAPVSASKVANPTLIDYADTGAYVPALWCVEFTSSNNPITYEGILPELPLGDPAANDDGTAPWCIVSQSNELIGDMIVRTDTFFGSGDPGPQFK